MEIDELKTIWQKEKDEMQSRLHLNATLIRELSFDKSRGAFEKLLKAAILGRNLALVYMAISFFIVYIINPDITYLISLIIGGLAMLFSFFQHLSIEKPDYIRMNTIELQKSICKFRIHILKHSKYDTFIVIIWLLTLIPTIFKYVLKLQIPSVLLISILILAVSLVLIYSKNIYKKWDDELKENEKQLNKLIDFEIN